MGEVSKEPTILEHTKEVDDITIEVVNNFDGMWILCKEDIRGAAERFDVDLITVFNVWENECAKVGLPAEVLDRCW